MTRSKKTVRLGDEHDDELRETLKDVFRELGGSQVDAVWGVGGSQVIERVEVRLGTSKVVVEAETYMGLAIHGNGPLVDRIAELVRARTSRQG